jgi:hypothetical protein
MSALLPNETETSMPLSATNESENETQTMELDLNAPIEVDDSSADFSENPPPPVAKRYPVRWKLQDKQPTDKSDGQNPACYATISAKGNVNVNLFIAGKLIAEDDEDANGFPINDYLNTVKPPRKHTSGFHSFLHHLGVTVPSRASASELIELAISTLESNPDGIVGAIELEWKASRQKTDEEIEKEEERMRATGKSWNIDTYKTLKQKMSQFPKLPDGTYQNWIESDVDGSRIYAQAYVANHVANV